MELTATPGGADMLASSVSVGFLGEVSFLGFLIVSLLNRSPFLSPASAKPSFFESYAGFAGRNASH